MSVSGPKIVPIFRVTREFYKGSVACSRTQFPPTVAFAVTVHKSQGLTLERAVMDISQREHIKTLDGVMFESNFDFKSFKGSTTETSQHR
ncbi:hypothetical protein CBS470a_013665 [Colletotrichum nupharicola]|nr:hypothetical protein CBS470a_013665 [Colletotrichum nupharicola]